MTVSNQRSYFLQYTQPPQSQSALRIIHTITTLLTEVIQRYKANVSTTYTVSTSMSRLKYWVHFLDIYSFPSNHSLTSQVMYMQYYVLKYGNQWFFHNCINKINVNNWYSMSVPIKFISVLIAAAMSPWYEKFNMLQLRSITAERCTNLASVKLIQSDGTVDKSTSNGRVVSRYDHTRCQLSSHMQQFHCSLTSWLF